jgi:hypothetical protein
MKGKTPILGPTGKKNPGTKAQFARVAHPASVDRRELIFSVQPYEQGKIKDKNSGKKIPALWPG